MWISTFNRMTLGESPSRDRRRSFTGYKLLSVAVPKGRECQRHPMDRPTYYLGDSSHYGASTVPGVLSVRYQTDASMGALMVVPGTGCCEARHHYPHQNTTGIPNGLQGGQKAS